MKLLVVANWKMNPTTFQDAKALLEATKKASEKSRVSLVVLPPTIYLRELRKLSRSKKLSFGVQNAHWEEKGAHTGETSLKQVKDAGVSHVLIGHAERRGMGETNDDTRKKVAAALANKMTPILCVGESSRSANGEHFKVVKDQLQTALADVPAGKLNSVIIVYEPLWTIGASSAMLPRDMHEMSIFMRKSIIERFGETGHGITILYGGSVDETNAAQMITEGDVHGLLVGRASEDPVRVRALLEVLGK